MSQISRMPIGLLENPEVKGPIRDINVVYPTLHKSYNKVRRRITRSAKRGEMCHGDVNYKYVKCKIKKSPYLLFFVDEDGDIDGFSTISFMDPQKLRVEVICTLPGVRGVGSALIRATERIAQFSSAKKIVVKSLPGVVEFYKKNGFSEDPTIKLPQSAIEKDYSGSKYIILSKSVGDKSPSTRKRKNHIFSRRTLRASQK